MTAGDVLNDDSRNALVLLDEGFCFLQHKELTYLLGKEEKRLLCYVLFDNLAFYWCSFHSLVLRQGGKSC